MKFRALTVVALVLFSFQSAHATPTIVVKAEAISFDFEPTLKISRSLLTNNSVIVVGANLDKGEVRAHNFAGEQLWRFSPSNSVFISDIKQASDGTYWVVGAGEIFDSKTVTIFPGVLNPDSIVVTNPAPVSRGLVQLQIWQLSSQGVPLTSIIYNSSTVLLPRALLISETGIVVVGEQQSKGGRTGAIWICTLSGCNPPTLIGKNDTSLRDITSSNDGFYVVGQSADVIAKLPLKGVVDGITLKVTDSGEVKKAFRSSLPTSRRTWESVTNGIIQGGFSSAKLTEATITKFNSSANKFGVPIWSARYLATSSALTAGSAAIFTSNGAIAAIKNWKPKTPQLILLTFDAKGLITSGTKIINAGTPLALSYYKGLGYGVISSQKSTVSFTLVRA